MTAVANAIGSKRIYPSASILYPLGKPSVPMNQEKKHRVAMAKEALKVLL